MPNEFTKADWTAIRKELAKNAEDYGLPPRKYGYVYAASFNIRKLGSLSKRSDETMQFFADTCRQFDLVAVQEVMPDTEGILRLCELMGPEYALLVSDIVGENPGEEGNAERLAFIYNTSLLFPTGLIGQISASRKSIFNVLNQKQQLLSDKLDKARLKHQDLISQGKKSSTSPLTISSVGTFVQYIRTPYVAGFEARGHPGADHYRFVAVNAHLLYGDRVQDRRDEARELFRWIIATVKDRDQNVLLLGDLNFDFDNEANDRKRVAKEFKELGGFGEGADKIIAGFPFIFPRKDPPQFSTRKDESFRTNVVLNQTFDQIGIYTKDPRANRLATTEDGHLWGEPFEDEPEATYPDYGVFNYANLFSRALNGKVIDELTKEEKKAFINRFQHEVSDHMPIWVRIPLPLPSPTFD